MFIKCNFYTSSFLVYAYVQIEESLSIYSENVQQIVIKLGV